MMNKPTIITGIQKAYVALLTKDDSTGLTYATPKYYAGVQELGYKPKQNVEVLYAENQIFDQSITFQQADISLKLASLTSAQRAELLGQTIGANGGVFASQTDVSPYVALLYKATIAGGYRYGVFYKGMFQMPDEDIKSQEGKTAYAVPSMAGLFQPSICNGIYEYHIDTTDPNCPANIDNTWFTAVTLPTADTTAPTVTTTPASGATAVAVSSSVIWTFSKAIDSSKVLASNFMLVKATDGSLVSGTLSLDSSTSKIVTFAPTTNLSAATTYIAIASGNVTDSVGNHLTQNAIKFTTA